MKKGVYGAVLLIAAVGCFWAGGIRALAQETAPGAGAQETAPGAGAQGISYGFVQADRGGMWQNADGTWAKDCWIALGNLKWHLDGGGYIQVGMTEVDGSTYYLKPDGSLFTGWLSEKDALYFFGNDGVMVKDATVGQYRFGKDGKLEEILPQEASPLAQCVTQILSSVTTPEMTADQKLLAAYQYILDHTSYKRTYETPAGDWTGEYALEVFTTGKGNCFRYAAAFASLARGLGYETRVATGQIHAARGGVTPHGWTEILIGEEWYLFDPDMEDAKKQDFYFKTYETYPVKPLIKQAEWPVIF